MDTVHFLFCSIRPQKLKNNPTYQSTPGCAELKSVRVKVELARKNGETTSNTGSKDYVRLVVQRIHRFAHETHASG